MKILMEFQLSDNSHLSPVFMGVGYQLLLFWFYVRNLEYFELWRAAVVFFCNLHIISCAVRYRENSHGISKF